MIVCPHQPCQELTSPSHHLLTAVISAPWLAAVGPGGMTVRMTTKQAARVPYGPHGCAQGRKGSQACRTGERERHGSLVAPPDERPAQASRCPRGHLCE